MKTDNAENTAIKNELLSKTYYLPYLFIGKCNKTVEVNGRRITYSHHECFLADNQYPSDIKKVIRITGNNVTGKPISITDCIKWKIGEYGGYRVFFNDNNIDYTLFSNNLDCYGFDGHYISGYEAEELVNNHNVYVLNHEANDNDINAKTEVDSMFQ